MKSHFARASTSRVSTPLLLTLVTLVTVAACGGSNDTNASGGAGGMGTTGSATTSTTVTGTAGGTTGDAGPGEDASTGGSTPGAKLEVIAGAVGQAGDVDGPQGTSRLLDVGGMAYLAPTLYVADRHHAIRKIDIDSRMTTTAVDDAGLAAPFFQPIALTRASDNELFVLQGLKTMTNGVVGQLGRYNVASGVFESELTPDSFVNLAYDITVPVALAVETTGDVLIGDRWRVDATTYQISDIGIRSVWGTSATLTAWVPIPGATYSLHSFPSMVLKSDLVAKTWTLVTGDDMSPTQPAVDGPKGTSRFSDSVGSAAYDGNGHLYVADTHASAIRKVDVATGAITTVIGELSPSGSIVVGDLAKARLHHPMWVTWLGDGKLAIGCPEDFVVLMASGL